MPCVLKINQEGIDYKQSVYAYKTIFSQFLFYFRHSFGLHVVKLVECFACAKESSLFTFDQNKEENDALDEFLDLNGLRKWPVATTGLCLITSLTIAMKQHL